MLTVIYWFIPLAYLIGSIPTGIAVARLFGGADPRTVGSKNIGATNVSRSAGKAAGVITLAGDALKGALPAYLALFYNPDPVFVSLIGAAAFTGHVFPVFLGFKGGKGVATALGVMMVVSPMATLLSALVFVLLVALKRYVSLGSMVSAALLPVFLSATGSRAFVPMGVYISVLVIIKHKDNIKRLIEGRENKIFKGKG